MWRSLELMYSGNKKDRIVDIMLELKDIKMGYEESVDHYMMRVRNLRSKVQSFGGSIDPREFIFYVTRGINEKLENIAVVLRSRRDATLDEVHNILKEEENRRQTYHRGNQNKQHNAYKSRETKDYKSAYKHKAGGKECFICQKQGHLAKDCWFRKDTAQNRNRPRYQDKRGKGNARVAVHEHEVALSANTFQECDEEQQNEQEKWNLDSGCSTHMTSNSDGMFNTQKYDNDIQMAEKGRKIVATSKGELRMTLTTDMGRDKRVRMHNVLYVPKLQDNLMSVRELVHQGNTVLFNNKGATIMDPQGNIVAIATELNGLYTLLATRTCDKDNITNDTACHGEIKLSNHVLWHRRLGHINFDYLQIMKHNNLVIGLQYKNNTGRLECPECILGKMCQKPFAAVIEKQATKPLELLHMDLCGPLPINSLGGNRYAFVIVDTFTRRVFVRLLKHKYEAFDEFLKFKAFREREIQLPISRVRTDNGLEFINHKFEIYFEKCGIKHEKTVPYSPQSNGIAERANRTLIDTARTMLIDSELPTEFWGEAILTAAYLRDRSYRKGLDGITPLEKWCGRKPKVNHLKVFGCLCYYWINSTQRNKLNARAATGIFVGYSRCRIAYRVYIPHTGKIIETRDVRFSELQKGKKLLEEYRGTGMTEDNLKYIIPASLETLNRRHIPAMNEDTSENTRLNTETDREDLPETDVEVDTEDDIRAVAIEPVTRQRGRPVGTKQGVVDDRKKLENSEREQELLTRGVRRSERIKEKETANITMNMSSEESDIIAVPTNYKQAVNSEYKGQWMKAMEEEINSLKTRKVWKLVDRKEGMRVIKNRWIYTVKNEHDKKKKRFKARLVALGNRQREGVDYEETYAPVIKYESLRLLITLASQMKLEIVRYDVKTAYLYADLKEEIFMEQPDGMIEDGNKVCRLMKSLYGLPQSGHNWNVKLDSVLKKIGFRRLKTEPSIYVMKRKMDVIYLGVYVDDLLVVGSNETWTAEIMKNIQSEFEIREEKGDGDYLGIEIKKTVEGYSIGQEKHIEKLITQYGMNECKPSKVPVDLTQKLEEYEESKQVDKTKYQEMIGMLSYIANGTRPDVMFAVNRLSQYSNDPREIHLGAAKKVIRYLKGTKKKRLYYGNEMGQVEIYSDASWCSSRECKSQTGYCVKIGNSTVNWKSKKQELVALSTCEAELNAICESVKEMEWMRNVVEELDINWIMEKPTKIYTDSKAAMDWSKNMTVKQRTKHFCRKLYKIRDEIETNGVKLVYKPSKELEADVLTKGVSEETLIFACNCWGLK